MLFIDLMELGICIMVIVFIYTQIIKPYRNGTKMFPMAFKERKLKSEIVGINQRIKEKKLEEEIKKIKKENGVK